MLVLLFLCEIGVHQVDLVALWCMKRTCLSHAICSGLATAAQTSLTEISGDCRCCYRGIVGSREEKGALTTSLGHRVVILNDHCRQFCASSITFRPCFVAWRCCRHSPSLFPQRCDWLFMKLLINLRPDRHCFVACEKHCQPNNLFSSCLYLWFNFTLFFLSLEVAGGNILGLHPFVLAGWWADE